MLSKRKSIILIIVLVLIAGGVVFWNLYKKRLVKQEVTRTVSEKTNNLYSISTGKLDLDEVAGNLAVTNISLQPDSLIYNQLSATGDDPGILVKLHIPSLSVTGVKTPKALLNSEIVGRRVLIDHPVIELFFTNKGKDSLRNVPDKEVYKQVLGNLKLLALDTVSIVNAQVITRDWKSGDLRMELDSVSIDLYGIAVDSLHDKDSTRIAFAEQVNLQCKKMSMHSKNKLYKYEIRNVDFNSGQKKLHVQHTQIIPNKPEAAFLQQFKYANDRFDISIRDISLVNLNTAAFMREKIEADSVVIGSSSYKIYRDLSYPHDGKNRIGTYPHQALMKMPVDIYFKTARFNNAYIEYKERNPKSKKSGLVRFHQVQLMIHNLTNQQERLKDNPVCKVDFRARFLDKAPISATINFYPLADNGKFTISGEMGKMPAPGVNELTEPMGLAKIETGTISRLNFSFAANDYRADGPLTILYDDLKVALLKRDSAENKLEKKKLVSLLAAIQVKKANPGKDKEVRREEVHFERDTKKSFFNLVWKSIFTGVKQSVGINK
ncbi:MAG: hypothetical protein P0Y53_13505 [Candidatus Pseudobacter hemicellulosilyticus]|uniref:DUF748 domain-containing protein n=1 Tax=Candidatus Pseudobacter hemicellulosilyticus TaxID=3121375 RepID=A0AAJ6BER6_9BACT|nr:MAG: hypothetical protein P0Y53_13505 [Pseudobacter sp.]